MSTQYLNTICKGRCFFKPLVETVTVFDGHRLFVKVIVLATLIAVPGTSSHLPLESRRYEIAWGEGGHWTTFWGKGGVPRQLEAFHCTLTGGLRQREI